jgi:hypothetical protein
MSYLLFMDESGHDHRNMPYEVRGGVAIHASRLWSFVQAMRSLEESSFGGVLHQYGKELKGHKLLDKDRFKWAAQGDWMDDASRRKACLAFLNRGLKKEAPRRNEFTAYGQACLTMVRGIYRLLSQHDARVFACAIPRGCRKPAHFEFEDYLRKDQVFLFESYFYFLEQEDEYGLLVLDETDKAEDRRFVQRMTNYFVRTRSGNLRSQRVVPTPLFVSSDMSYPIQAADCVIYCVNWGFRLPGYGMDAEVREEVAKETGGWITRLQAKSSKVNASGRFTEYGIKYIENPYAPGNNRGANKKGGKAHG